MKSNIAILNVCTNTHGNDTTKPKKFFFGYHYAVQLSFPESNAGKNTGGSI